MFKYYLFIYSISNTFIRNVQRSSNELIKVFRLTTIRNKAYKVNIVNLFKEYKNSISRGNFLESLKLRTIIDENYRLNKFRNLDEEKNLLIFRNALIAKETLKQRKDDESRRYYGNKIAILAPSINVLNKDSYDEINSYDYTIIPNYNEKNIHFGNITNKIIGIYTLKDYYDNISLGISSYQDVFEIILINHNPRLSSFNIKIKHTKFRFALFYRDIFFYGIPNKIQISLMDSLYNGASLIKLFNTNFFIENKYVRNIDYYKIPYVRVNFNHDLLSNFKLVKLMCYMKLIELDETTLSYIEISDNNYIEILENNLIKSTTWIFLYFNK